MLRTDSISDEVLRDHSGSRVEQARQVEAATASRNSTSHRRSNDLAGVAVGLIGLSESLIEHVELSI